MQLLRAAAQHVAPWVYCSMQPAQSAKKATVASQPTLYSCRAVNLPRTSTVQTCICILYEAAERAFNPHQVPQHTLLDHNAQANMLKTAKLSFL
jgi:hypothetical protein